MKKICLIFLFCLFAGVSMSADSKGALDKWHVGVSGGYHNNIMRFPGLSKDSYHDRSFLHSSAFAVFAEYDINSTFSVRPEFTFLSRGGKMTMERVASVYTGNYSLKSGYVDFRTPVLYKFNTASVWKPYLFASPVVGLSTGGNLTMYEQLYCGEEHTYDMELTKANMATAYFAVAAGAGVRYQIPVNGHDFYVGLEAGYEYGITDTYSSKEKSGESVSLNSESGAPIGVRKNSGMEIRLSVSVPLSIFKRKKAPVKPVEYKIVEKPVIIEQPEIKLEKPCYSLEEIKLMIAEGKSVKGKTICAINEINFDFDKSTIKEESKPYLDQLAHVLAEIDMEVEVKGHTDDKGSDEFNMRLSKDRALAVVNYLIEKGVSKDRISYSYYGERLPLTTNSTPEGRQQNRRVEFELIK